MKPAIALGIAAPTGSFSPVAGILLVETATLIVWEALIAFTSFSPVAGILLVETSSLVVWAGAGNQMFQSRCRDSVS